MRPRQDLPKIPQFAVNRYYTSQTPNMGIEKFDPFNLPHPDDAHQERDEVKRAMLGSIDKQKREYRATTRHAVRIIAPGQFHTYMNSVNVLTGDQGAGKTFTALMEALGVCRNTSNTTHLIFIRKKAFDPTFESVRSLFSNKKNEHAGSDCKIIELGYEEAEKFCQQFFTAKHIFNSMKRYFYLLKRRATLTDADMEEFGSISDEMVQGMFQMLPKSLFDRHDWLNTIVIFDDVGNSGLFKKPDSYFNNRLKLCRDDNAIYFLTIHGITQLSPSIKENTLIVYAFKGLTPNRLHIIYNQMNLPITLATFRGLYSGMIKSGKRFIWCDNSEGTWGIE
jgi:hypothetical protein